MNCDRHISFDALNDFSEMSFLLSIEGKILAANKSALTSLGKPGTELLDKQFISLLNPAHILKIENAIIKCISEREKVEIDCKFMRDGRGDIDAQCYFSVFSNGEKTSDKILIIAKDVTEEKQKELDLLRFYNVAHHTVNPLQITDLSGRMIYVNPAFVKMSGYKEEELLGHTPSLLNSGRHSKKFWDEMWHTISDGKVWVGEVANRKKNGEVVHTQLLISPIMKSEGGLLGYFGIHRDLTEKKNLEKQLIHTQKMESIGTLAAGVAHEVGNPLASISALVQIIQRSTEEVFIKEKLELVKKQITRISKIIRDLVDFSRPSNYELKLTDVNANLRESVEIVRVGKKAKDIEFVSDLDESIEPLHLVSDQLQQVFVNILINGVDAIVEKKGVTKEDYTGKIHIKTQCVNGNIQIIFYDNGPGVSEEHSMKIFEPFFTTKKEGKGTGLGLWVSYGIVKSFQGDIKVGTSPMGGAEFVINLPTNPVY
ncbi:MAG: PAS domain S-box protein [Ignavibacteriaceae bacterium]|nr:PAS domain S-box protein [Ignavibacteriaceae bacterium]